MSDERHVDPSSGSASQPGSTFKIVGDEAKPPAAYDDDADLTVAPSFEAAMAEQDSDPESEEDAEPSEDEPEPPASESEEEPEPEPEPEEDPEEEPEEPEYDPGDHTVEEVIAYVNENPESKDEVLAAEQAGKNRSTLVSYLQGG